jgi:hypothetical protein
LIAFDNQKYKRKSSYVWFFDLVIELPADFFGKTQDAVCTYSTKTRIAAGWIRPSVVHGVVNAHSRRYAIEDDASGLVMEHLLQ